MKIYVYKKLHKKNTKKEFNYFLDTVKFGSYGIQVLESGILVSEQIEIVRRLVSRVTKRLGFLFIRIFFHHPVTKKPLKSRMGKGVGIINNWISYVKKGMVILEINNVSNKLGINLFKVLKGYLPLRVSFISKEFKNIN